MNRDLFINRPKSSKPYLSDGAMGTLLNQRGASFDGSFDSLNLDNPTLVKELHLAYLSAGSDMIQTNTFGANRYKLARYGLEKKTAEINQKGVALIRELAAEANKSVLIAGDIGPLGIRLAPFGRVQPEQAYEAFLEQANFLLAEGIDIFIIETFTDLFEIKEAISACRSLNPEIPIIASMTYTRDDRTLLGDTPSHVAEQLNEFGADILGVNCSGGPSQILRILKQMRKVITDKPFSAMPNAGWPEQVGGRIMYPTSPTYFHEYALAFWEQGAAVIGGCCGTTPEHIAIMRKAIDISAPPTFKGASEIKIHDPQAHEPAEESTELSKKIQQKKFIVSVEMAPPRGLSTNKLLAGASLLAEVGADVINVADSPMARMRMSPWAVCALIQRKIEVETVLHFPTRGRNLLRVQGDLLAAHALGVRNVFVVMGDPTAIGDYPDANDNYDLVPSGLVKLIKQNFNAGVDHAGADIGQPTNFLVGCAVNLNPKNMDVEIKNLQRKLAAGADFLLSQPIYEPQVLETFLHAYETRHGSLPIPLFLGVLALVTPRHANFLHFEVPGISIPEAMRDKLTQAGDKSPQTGIQLAVELIQSVRDKIQGVYLMPAFNRFDYTAEIIDAIRKD